MVPRAGGNTSRKKFLALPASKKFHINHSEATSSTWLRRGNGAEGHEQKLPTLLNKCLRSSVRRNYVSPSTQSYDVSSSIIPLKTGLPVYYEATSVPRLILSMKPFYPFLFLYSFLSLLEQEEALISFFSNRLEEARGPIIFWPRVIDLKRFKIINCPI